ncbi:MAG: cytochrome c maturation protein CcmE [Gammaproteobacteria bacterium]|nr:cytochrome c maturation protein CcmE [Gammaproteobacteria bacterium]
MTPRRKKRLQIIFFVLAGAAIAVTLLVSALGQNMNHYYELSDIKENPSLIGKKIRIGGMVKLGSIKRVEGSLKVLFEVTNLKESIHVTYEGVLPDLFKEGKGVLAKGTLSDQTHFVAQEILAKHDENYMPKEVQQELEKTGYYRHTENNNTKTITE